MIDTYDHIIIGGGILGLATAAALPGINLVLEKEKSLATHQSGRNSGVIHSGIYYKPGSIKAVTCNYGKTLLERFCHDKSIPIRKCGKLIVATDSHQHDNLDSIYDRGIHNEINCEMMEGGDIRKIEPYAAGDRAIYVRDTGIVDFRKVCNELKSYSHIRTSQKVVGIDARRSCIDVRTESQIYSAKKVVNCGGLYADRIAGMCGVKTDLQIVPFRGVYYKLKDSAKHLCNTLIYPVPDPNFPFLGVHFTSTIDGGVEVGPNAVLAFGREAYRFRDINLRETFEVLRYSGARKLFARHWQMGAREMLMALSRRTYVKELKKLVPAVRLDDLIPRVSGIRAQAVDKDGGLIDDFRLIRDGDVLHVLNAPSPAATASLAIAEKIAEAFA
jgi:L-2-hydroxyglutarate oxidase